MSITSPIPLTESKGVVSYKIIAGDFPLAGNYQLISLSVQRSINKISSAKLFISDGDVAAQKFELSNKSDFIPGEKVKIELGYGTTTKKIFEGIVVKHSVKAQANKSSLLEVELKDIAVALTKGRNNAYFFKETDSSIMEEVIASNSDAIPLVSITTAVHDEMVQFNCSNWDFIVSRAEANGMFVYTNNGKIEISKPSFTKLPSVSAVFGNNIIDFEACMDASNQYTDITSFSWDASTQKIIDGESQVKGMKDMGNVSSDKLAGAYGEKKLNLYNSGFAKDKELTQWASAKLIRSKLSKIRGRVTIEGFGGVMPGDIMKLDGVGTRFNGEAFVSSVKHDFSNGLWLTYIEFGISPENFMQSTPDVVDVSASGLLPAIKGLTVGVVLQLENDPENAGRILIKLPVISEKEDGVWARLSTVYAGNNYGSFILPEVGDEVIVGFVNEDPRFPVVMGSVYSAKNVAPLTASDDNFEKGFITKGELKLTFNDEDKSFTIETPKGNKMVLSEKEESILIQDQSGNKIEMSADGITLESAKDLILKATGDVKIDGVNIENKASASYKADGGSGAELTTSAIMKVKGQLVQIN